VSKNKQPNTNGIEMFRKISLHTIIKLIIGVSSLSIMLSASTVNLSVYAESTSINQLLTQLFQRRIKKQAAAITVQVLSTEFLGSGILLKKQNNI
jgi:hypothetical protein